MAIETYVFTSEQFRATVYDGTAGSLAEVREIAGAQFESAQNNLITIRGIDGSFSTMTVGWGIRDQGGYIAIASPGSVARTWRRAVGS